MYYKKCYKQAHLLRTERRMSVIWLALTLEDQNLCDIRTIRGALAAS